MEKKLASPPLVIDQDSITEIPRKLYEFFYKQRIGESVKTEEGPEMRVWCELPAHSKNKKDKVIVVFTESIDGDSTETRCAFTRAYPCEVNHANVYEFEIFARPESKGWKYSEGSRFIETLSYRTYPINGKTLPADHPMTDYVAQALLKMRRLIKGRPGIIRQEFVDHAAKAPR
ncbi:MAG TPA: hypothetical protein VGE18_01175 [Candidatus Paceibacterota bacterium]